MPRKIDIARRQFAAQAAALGVALAFGRGGAAEAAQAVTERRDLYPQGVASGDPAADSVILWTRRPPVASSVAQRLRVEIASDPNFAHIVARGRTNLSAEMDYTCRFLAGGLQPAHEYFFRFIIFKRMQ